MVIEGVETGAWAFDQGWKYEIAFSWNSAVERGGCLKNFICGSVFQWQRSDGRKECMVDGKVRSEVKRCESPDKLILFLSPTFACDVALSIAHQLTLVLPSVSRETINRQSGETSVTHSSDLIESY